MIFKTHVKAVAEEFLSSALKSYPNTKDALLSHPKLSHWYEILANELTKLEAESILTGQPFNADQEIRVWVSGYVEHALKPNKDKYTNQIKSTMESETSELV